MWNADRYRLLERLFHEAVAQPPEARRSFCTRVADGDDELAKRLLRLIAEHEGDAHSRFGGVLYEMFRPDPDSAESLPAVIGPYRILKLIGRGGMGSVFLAKQEAPIRREVALKILHEAFSGPESRARFQRERDVLARLDHPCIVCMLDAGDTDSGRPYYVMEHVADGRSVTEYALAEGLDVRARLELFLRVCGAVHHGHERGVLHRDLKPSNILVRSDGEPRVIDFGVARMIDASWSGVRRLTMTGDLIGTPLYLSPEQCRGESGIGVTSDGYALGVVLCELLSGEPPYDVSDKSALDVLDIIENTPPQRPSKRAPGLHRDLDAIVLKALEKDPERRYASTRELASDIERHLAGEAVLARRPRRFRTLHVAVAAILVAFIGWAVQLLGSSPRASVSNIQPERARVRPLARLSHGIGGFPAVLDEGCRFGAALAPLGDVDGDGTADFAVGAPGHDDGGTDRGLAWVVLLREDGTVKAQRTIRPGQQALPADGPDALVFGSSLDSIGDLDEDGVVDLLVGAPTEHDRHSLWITYLESDGWPVRTAKVLPPPSTAHLGMPGIGSLALLYTHADRVFVGIHTLTLGTGVLALERTGLAPASSPFLPPGELPPGDGFGASIARIGRVDGGMVLAAVGAPGTLQDDEPTGAVWLMDPQSFASPRRIGPAELGLAGRLDAGDAFGAGLASAGDIDGDGIMELFVGAVGDDDGGTDVGAVWVLFFDDEENVRDHWKLSVENGAFPSSCGAGSQLGADMIALESPVTGEVSAFVVGAPGDGPYGAVHILAVDR